MRNNNMWTDKEFRNGLLKLALPIAAQSFMLSAVGVADTLMLGGVEQNAMSAVSLATKIQFIQNMFISSFVAALVILGAQYMGKKDERSVSKLFCITLNACGAAALLFFIACEFFPQYIMLAFTNDPELIRIAADYLRIAAWSYLLTGVSQCYIALLKISDRANKAATISSVAVVCNIALNAVFIFGLAGIPAMGVRGAALATLISRVIEMLWAVGLSFRESYFRPDFRQMKKADPALRHDFLVCLWPLLGASLLWGVGFTAYSAFMGHLDKDAPAANSVASSVIELMCCMCNGLASGGGILVGNALGSGDLEKGKLYGIRIVKLSFPVGIITSLLMFAITPLVMAVVHLTPTAEQYLHSMMLVMSVYTVGRVVNTMTINGIIDAGGDTAFDMYSLAVVMWGVALPLAALGTFVFHWPVWVVYACTCVDEVGKIPWVIAHFRKYKWVKDLTREEGQ